MDLCSGGTGRLSSVSDPVERIAQCRTIRKPSAEHLQLYQQHVLGFQPHVTKDAPATTAPGYTCTEFGMHMALPSDIPHRREPHVRLTWCDGYSQVMVLGLELMMAGHEGAMSSDILFPSVIRHTLRQATERLRKVPRTYVQTTRELLSMSSFNLKNGV